MNEQVFVGRERELCQLTVRLEAALSGHGGVCFVRGQAGSGKSALVRRFVAQSVAEHPDLIAAIGTCNAQTGVGDPFLPFREILTALTAGQAEAALAAAGKPKGKVMSWSVQVLVDVAPDLVGAFVPGARIMGALGKAVAQKAGWMDKLERLTRRSDRPGGAGESVIDQSHVFEQYTAFLDRLSKDAPLMLVLDDLHWADNSSLGLLFHLARRIESSPILMVGTYRSIEVGLGRADGRHPLESILNELTRYQGDITIDLDSIPEPVGQSFVDALLDSEPNRLGPKFRKSLYHQTGGHALFTVELLRALQERGDIVKDGSGCWVDGPHLDWAALPARVSGVIEERIGRLSDELQHMLTVASVEGEEFFPEVVGRVLSIAERDAIQKTSEELDRHHHLVEPGGSLQLGALRLFLYHFLHNLFQQYLYNRLDEAERAYLHSDVGRVLETLFADHVADVAAPLARHFEIAGIPAKAAAYRLQAANQARRLSANQEAVDHLNRGLELLESVPQGPERMQLELGLQATLGMTLIATEGYASPGVDRAFGQARELCRALGDPPQLIPILFGQCLFDIVRGCHRRAYREAEHTLELAGRAGEEAFVVGCRVVLGAASLYLGLFEQARIHLEEALAQYVPARHADVVYQIGTDPMIAARAYLAWLLWLLGYSDQAAARRDELKALGDAADHPYSRVFASIFVATVDGCLRRWSETEQGANLASDLSLQNHFPHWRMNAAILHGWAIAHQGDADGGSSEMRLAIDKWGAMGASAAIPFSWSGLAEIYLNEARREEGLAALDRSLEVAQASEEGLWLAEQHRIRAELLLLEPGHEAEAETLLHRALEIANVQEARALELRAAMSLARLLSRAGRAGEGRGLLAGACAWFTEGLETADLRDARTLLAQLASKPAAGGARL